MNFLIENLSMICGSYEAEIRKYKKVIGKSGETWLYAIQDNSADNIYVSDKNPNSDGFGGRTLEFILEDGTILPLKAPWHSNAGALFNDTGIDLRDKHLTFVVIALDRKMKSTKRGYLIEMIEVIYKDEHPIISEYNRGEKIAQKLANELNRPVICYSQGISGSSNGMIEPTIKEK